MLTEIRLNILIEQGNQMANKLHASMISRSQPFFNNNAFLSALLLDPRYNCSGESGSIFSPAQRDQAIVSIRILTFQIIIFDTISHFYILRLI